jgi:hypothetical protein
MEMFMSVLLGGTRIRVVGGENMDLFSRNDNLAVWKMIASSVEEISLPDWPPMGLARYGQSIRRARPALIS